MTDLVLQVWNFLGSYIPSEYLGIVGAIVVLANAVTAVTASKSTNPVVQTILHVLNVLAVNVGKNKNADSVK